MSGTANTEIDNVTLLLIEVMMYLPFPSREANKQSKLIKVLPFDDNRSFSSKFISMPNTDRKAQNV